MATKKRRPWVTLREEDDLSNGQIVRTSRRDRDGTDDAVDGGEDPLLDYAYTRYEDADLEDRVRSRRSPRG